MEKKLADYQARIVLRIIQERDALNRELAEYVEFVSGAPDGQLVQRADGLYAVVPEEEKSGD